MLIKLSDHFTYGKLLRFTFPSIIMVIFTSIYSVVDGLFVANFAGPTPFAAVNIVWPFIMLAGAVGFMFGSGGSALVAKMLGEGHHFKAKQIFSLLIYTTIVLGIVLGLIGIATLRPLLYAYDINGALFEDCLVYGYILLPALPALMLQFIFQAFAVTAERPKLGMIITIIAGMVNFGLDYMLIVVYHQGLSGAAIATAASQIIGAGIPLLYFAMPNKSLLQLGCTKLYLRALLKAGLNGISEFLSSISMALVGMLYNYQMMRLIGENGVVAFGIISYVNFIFLAAFLGYGVGSNPVVSYNYGAQNKAELHNVFIKSLHLIAATAIILTAIAELTADIIAGFFVSNNADLMAMTTYGFRIYAISFLLAGFNIYASAFFTALNNGLVSAVISFFRTMVFECVCVLLLPVFFGLNGIWAAIIVAEILALMVCIGFWKKLKLRYGY